MKEDNHIMTVGGKNTTITDIKSHIKAIYVTYEGEVDDYMKIINNDDSDDNFEVAGQKVQDITYLNKSYPNGFNVEFKGNTSKYILVWSD